METMILVSTPACMNCNESSMVQVSESAYLAWQGGTYIQTAFPELSADERELIKSGIHPECWTAMFGDDEEDDE